VNTLLGLWRLLTAQKLNVREATREVLAFLEGLDLQRLFTQSTWRELNFFALVQVFEMWDYIVRGFVGLPRKRPAWASLPQMMPFGIHLERP
jgi:hypothetical protein